MLSSVEVFWFLPLSSDDISIYHDAITEFNPWETPDIREQHGIFQNANPNQKRGYSWNVTYGLFLRTSFGKQYKAFAVDILTSI